MMLSSLLLCLLVNVFDIRALAAQPNNLGSSFDGNYAITWGNNYYLDTTTRTLVNKSFITRLSFFFCFIGSGFGSKLSYGSGLFHFRIMLPAHDSAGVVTAYYLTSHGAHHDELDFEFLGNKEGKPYTLQTNVFTQGQGNREQRITLWFDPTTSYHAYRILWNPYQIVFYVDDTPIRVYKNKTNIGVKYPSQPMQIVASLWDGESWATDGGQTKTDWTQAPFKAYFKGFNISGCPSYNSNIQHCYSSKIWWNRYKYRSLSRNEEKLYEVVRDKYLNYDYCSDRSRYSITPPECPHQ
ncbi:hypothetical protein GIB67_024556 [Kingdonia uniflora]|uniref:Xyloglucan endotransglucosylase/hydrolase n=1 Tax=Kingdonia uniflora TaxID=39325 RepID=A0A7J7LP40_9MAGN|nr:hypothetical protein GIB67_024556 [Kingdonia uniflora]